MKWLTTTLLRIFPPPRRAVRWTAVIPLVGFLAVFASTMLFLLFTNRIEFLYPWAFSLLVVTPWIWWMQAAGYSGLTASRGNTALLIRLIVAGLLVTVLALPRAVKTSDVVSVIYNVDISDSVNEAKDTALSIVATTVAEKISTDQAGLVVFGRTPAVEYPPRETFPFEKYLNSQVGKDATNLQQSLSLSLAMLPEENQGRVVLISDGTATVGELKHAVTELQARGVQVDVMPVDYQYDHEVLLERLDLPRFVRIGETYEAATVLTSLKDGSGTLVLTQNDEELQRMPVEFRAGKNRFAVPIKVGAPGYYEYSARIEVPASKDNRVENNEVRNYLYIDGPGRVLIVTDPQGNPREWKYIEQALRQGEREVQTMNAREFPHDPLQLMPYDAIVFANVPADAFLANQVQAVHDAVRNLGIGFVMLGGPNSFGPGGYQNSPIEDCLPISMEISKKKILPKGALVIILHTCEFPQGNTWAKRITKEAIRVLSAEDEVGAIGYSMNGDEWIFELTPASEYDKLVTSVNGAQIGDMPEFTSTMKLGLEGLLKSDAASRHMIIISDGDPPMPPPKILKEFQDSQTTISTVAVFPHDPRDAQVLNAIASATGGRFYFPSDPRQLPSIFIKEAKTLRRSQIQKRTFTPTLVNDDPVLRDIRSMPPLHGYVLASEKEDPRATILLSAPPEEKDMVADDSDVDPILAVWRYGLGATAAYTSDLTEDWGKDWIRWKQFQQLVTQLMTRVSRVRREQFLRVYTYVNGNEGVVVVEDFHPEESLLDMNVTVSSGDDFRYSGAVRQIAPRRYQATIPLQGKARYQVQISADGSDRQEIAYGGFIVSYSPEYLRFQANPIVLREIAEQTGGQELDAELEPEKLAEQIYGRRESKRSTRSVFDWFLMALACMIPLDVAVRRVQLDFTWLKRMFTSRRNESTATMGALLQKAESVRSTMTGQKSEITSRKKSVERPMQPGAIPPRSSQNAANKTQPQEAPPSVVSEQPVDDGSTTSRLLAMKRQREDDTEEET
ncbi:MAG: VWA domain-containing protein [Fuerstiella sp.]|nr:VWA domain-containing protein [Fuerstiella sp.]MCP4858225.1 VWA domain-containing protein [Fuerstiella sp.]